MRRNFVKSAVITAALALGTMAVPASALAGGNATCQGYNSQTSSVTNSCHKSTQSGPTAIDQGQVKLYHHTSHNTTVNNETPSAPSTPSTTVDTRTGSLPFTGIDVGLLLAGAAVLLAAGLVIRRLSGRID